ncbi:MAG: AsmA family protein, partial [Deltaproteobacteria bacterium]
MSNVFKWLGLASFVLALLIAGFGLFVRLYLTSDFIISRITPPLENYLHRKVSLTEASLGLRGFRLKGLDIRKEGSSTALLKGDQLELRWNPVALLRRKIEIDALAFTRPEITLIRQQDGALNIADLLSQKTGRRAAASPADEKVESKPANIALLVSLLAMEDGSLILVDRSRKPEATLQLTNIESQISDISTTKPIPFQVEGQLGSEGKGFLMVNGFLDLAASTLEGNVDLKGIDLASLVPFIASDDSLAFQQGSLTLAASFAAKGLDDLTGKGSFTGAGLQIRTNQKLTETMEVAADFKLHGLRSQHTLTIETLDLVLNGQSAQLQGLFSRWHQRPQLEFSLTSPEIKLDELLALLPADPPPSKTLQSKSEEPLPDTPPSSASDDPTLPASTPAETQSSTEASLESEPIPLAPAGTEQAAKSIVEPVSRFASLKTKPIPLDVEGELHLDWFFYHKLVASNVDCQLSLSRGSLELEPFSASLYGGELAGTFKAGMQKPDAPFRSQITTKDVLLDEVLRALFPDSTSGWSGNVSLNSRASGVITDLSAIESSTDLTINEAQFSGHPLILKLAELFQNDDLQLLLFSTVTARIGTSGRLITIEDLHMEGPVAKIEGGGTAGLLDRKLDLRAHIKIPAQYAGKLEQFR